MSTINLNQRESLQFPECAMDIQLFADRLTDAVKRKLGERYGYKQFEQLCRDTDAANAPSYNTLRNAMRGEGAPKVDNVLVMAKALDVSVDWLVGLTEDEHSHKKTAPPREAEEPINMGAGQGSHAAAEAMGLVTPRGVPKPSITMPGWELISDDGSRLRIDLCVEGEAERSSIKASWQGRQRDSDAV